MVCADVRECLQVQLDCLQGRVPGRHIAHRIVTDGMALLAAHEYDALARLLDLELDQVMEGVRLVLSLDARPGVSLAPAPTGYIVPDVVAWHADCAWRVALNPATTPRLRVNAMQERALDQAEPSEGAGKLRELLQEARWLTRGLSIRYDTLLRTARAIVERQAGFLTQGDEAMAPLTLKEIADAIGMHESTVSRITTGKYMQTPRRRSNARQMKSLQRRVRPSAPPCLRRRPPRRRFNARRLKDRPLNCRSPDPRSRRHRRLGLRPPRSSDSPMTRCPSTCPWFNRLRRHQRAQALRRFNASPAMGRRSCRSRGRRRRMRPNRLCPRPRSRRRILGPRLGKRQHPRRLEIRLPKPRPFDPARLP